MGLPARCTRPMQFQWSYPGYGNIGTVIDYGTPVLVVQLHVVGSRGGELPMYYAVLFCGLSYIMMLYNCIIDAGTPCENLVDTFCSSISSTPLAYSRKYKYYTNIVLLAAH